MSLLGGRAPALLLLLLSLGLAGLEVSRAWHLVMKLPQGGDLGPGVASVYDLWLSDNVTLNEEHKNALNVQPGIPYKSRAILDWDSQNISLVKVAFYSAGEEVAQVVFSAAGAAYNHTGWPVFPRRTNITAWFDCARILHSTWPGLAEPGAGPDVCSIHSPNTVEQSFSVMSAELISQSDCDNMTGWFTVLEPDSLNSVVKCDWQPTTGSPPYFLFSTLNGSQHFSSASTANVFAVFVDDCIDGGVCHSEACWQDPLGNCQCNGYRCAEECSRVPCGAGETCVTDPKNDSAYTCQCERGYKDNICLDGTPEPEGLQGGAIAGIVLGILVFVGLLVLAGWLLYSWRIKKDPIKQEMTHKAVLAKDFVRRSVHRLSGRSHQFPRRHLKEEKASPPLNQKSKSEQLSPESSVVFGSSNPAFLVDEPTTPTPTPPPDRRYTEFPSIQAGHTPATLVSNKELKLHEIKQTQTKVSKPVKADVHSHKQYANVPYAHGADLRTSDPTPHADFDRASTIGSFEKASTMSELSDATSTSGFSDYTQEAPAHLPPSEMISKDVVLRHGHHHRHKARPRPRSRTSTTDHPRSLVAQPTIEGQIKYALERSRLSISSMSSLSSDATHRSDGTQRSAEQTKSDVLRSRYENISGQIVDPAVDLPRMYLKNVGNYEDIKKQLDEDMIRREAREMKRDLELEHENRKYEVEQERERKARIRQVESLDSGIDAENAADRYPEGRLEIVRARSADDLDSDSVRYTSSAREATV